MAKEKKGQRQPDHKKDLKQYVMGILQKGRERNSGKATFSRQNKKANLKLDVLTELFASAAEDKIVDIEKNFLQNKVYLEGFRYLNELALNYNYENRLYTVTYTLEVAACVKTDTRFMETGSAKFVIWRGGRNNHSEISWKADSFCGSAKERDSYLKRLNHPLILERIRALELLDIYAEHTKGSCSWTILADSLIGSATWLLLPPTTNLIQPTNQECILFYELFELVADAVINNQ